MTSYQDLLKFYDVVEGIIEQPTTSLAQYKFSQNYVKYSGLFDFFLSLSMETKTFAIRAVKNSYDEFDFERDIGKVLYYYINDDRKQLQLVVNSLPYVVQKLLYIVFSNALIKKITELYALETMSTYYKLSELLTFVKFPDIVNISDIPIQNVDNVGLNTLTFPIRLFKIPSGFKFHKLVYVSYDGISFISNIRQGSIRQDIKDNVQLPSFSLLGIVTKNRKYRRKYKLFVFYFSLEKHNAIDFFKGKAIYNNKLKDFENIFKNTNIDIIKSKVLNNEQELLEFLKHRRNRENVIIQTDSSVDLIKIDVQYKNVPILDYIYNDDFEAIGLKIEYQGKIYDLYFNVMNTTYVDSIDGRFVRVVILSYKNRLINIMYNSEVKVWHAMYDKCVMCKTTEYGHAMRGICNSCINKLKKITENISGTINIKCDTIFSLVLNNCTINSDGNILYIKPMRGKQLTLPFNEEVLLCEQNKE